MVNYVVPAKLHKKSLPKAVTFYFRVREPMNDITIEISKDDKLMRSIHKDMVIPSEMEQVVIAGTHLEETDGDLMIQIKEN